MDPAALVTAPLDAATSTADAPDDLCHSLRSWQQWQQSYNELYKRHVTLCDELTAAHETIERLQRAETPPLQRR